MKRETRISDSIRKKLKECMGITLHKNHGGAYGETGAADLYGTLPGGRAIYIEVKTPETKNQMSTRRLYQERWLERERKLGAAAYLVASFDELSQLMGADGIAPISQIKKLSTSKRANVRS